MLPNCLCVLKNIRSTQERVRSACCPTKLTNLSRGGGSSPATPVESAAKSPGCGYCWWSKIVECDGPLAKINLAPSSHCTALIQINTRLGQYSAVKHHECSPDIIWSFHPLWLRWWNHHNYASVASSPWLRPGCRQWTWMLYLPEEVEMTEIIISLDNDIYQQN